MQLLNRVDQPSLISGRVHFILTLVHKSPSGLPQGYIFDMLSLKSHSLNVRTSGTHSLLILALSILLW